MQHLVPRRVCYAPGASRVHEQLRVCTLGPMAVEAVKTRSHLNTQDLTDLADRMAHGIEVKDRTRHFKKYRCCFTGRSVTAGRQVGHVNPRHREWATLRDRLALECCLQDVLAVQHRSLALQCTSGTCLLLAVVCRGS